MASAHLLDAVTVVDPGNGVYDVCGKLWTVGARYQVCEYVGGGSYGEVCRATDMELGMSVAIKKVADILCSPVLAKRILREVCIMRRLSHPYIISLTDVFTQPSLETERGLDLYIATEFANRGDMYHLRERLSSEEVKRLMWQLLVGVEYMHSVHVWHRDIKSENVLLSFNNSTMQVKLCDFGLSRSAMETFQTELRYSMGTSSAEQSKRRLVRQYTKTVVTPSYRAPEVVMSQGQYSSPIDVWSLGCIFWELLMRQLTPQRTGPPSRPLFGVRGEPATPERGENYAEDGHSTLAEQLDVIFNVIGTPCWKDIESVPSESWRNYLKRLPGRAGNLGTQLGSCDPEGLDLLSRMLAFDPSRRCTAEEALSHTYFKSFKKHVGLPQVSVNRAPTVLPDEPFWTIRDPATALGVLERELEQSVHEKDGGQWKLLQLLRGEVEDQQLQHRLLVLQAEIVARNIPVYHPAQDAAAGAYQVVQAPVTMQLFPPATAGGPMVMGNPTADPGGVVLVSTQQAMEWQSQMLQRESEINLSQMSRRDTGGQSRKQRKTNNNPGQSSVNPSTRHTRATAAAAAAAAASAAAAAAAAGVQTVDVNMAALVPGPPQSSSKVTGQRRGNNRVSYEGNPALPRRSPRLRDLHSGARRSQEAGSPQYATLWHLLNGQGLRS